MNIQRLLILASMIAICALVTGGAVGQAHPGGVLVGGGYPSNSTSYLNGLFLAQKSGAYTTLIDTFTAKRPYYFDDAEMDMDNRSVVFGCRGSSSTNYNLTYGLFRWNAGSGLYSTIVRDTSAFYLVHGVHATQDGDWMVATRSRVSNQYFYNVLRVAPNGTWTTALTTMQLGHSQNFVDPIARDVDTGDMLIPSNQKVSFFTRPVYAISNDGSFSSWHTSSNGPSPTYGWDQEVATGDMLYFNSSYLYRCSKGGTAVKSKPVVLDGQYGYGLTFENQSTPNPLVIVYTVQQITTLTRASLSFIDPNPTTPAVVQTVTFLQANSKVQVPYHQHDITNHRDRYIQGIKTGKGKWDLLFDFPAFPNKFYVVAGSFSGVRPPIRIAGRKIWLTFDALFALTATNQLRPFFNPGPQYLDGNGRAKGSINLSMFSSPIGVTVHFVVGVADPAAPQGVAFITEPYPMQL